jgi:hypothetical protein
MPAEFAVGLALCFLAGLVFGPAVIGWLAVLTVFGSPGDAGVAWLFAVLEAILVHMLGQICCLKVPPENQTKPFLMSSLVLNALAVGIGMGVWIGYKHLWTSPLARLTEEAAVWSGWPRTVSPTADALVVLGLATGGVGTFLPVLKRLGKHLHSQESDSSIGLLQWFWMPAAVVSSLLFLGIVASLVSVRIEGFDFQAGILLASGWGLVIFLFLPLVLWILFAVWLKYCGVLAALFQAWRQWARMPPAPVPKENPCRSM